MLPRFALLTEVLARTYGDGCPRLCALHEAFANFRDARESNLEEEAGTIFPLCRRLDTAGRHVPFHGSLTAAIRLLQAENADACAALAKMRALMAGVTPPAGDCAALFVLLDALGEMEADACRHARKETSLLFPAIRLLTALEDTEPGFRAAVEEASLSRTTESERVLL
jgi:iron-sulfur cluster repair protein YtfE (RIC family)